MICYYAHARALYGTLQEKRDVELLEKLGFTVLNPNTELFQEEYKVSGKFSYFLEKVQKADVLAFRALPGLKISAGVFKEIKHAQKWELPVIELPSSILQRDLTSEQTLEYLREVGER